MKLYHSASSPNSRRVRIFLAEKGLSIPLVTVDLGKGEQHSDAYRTINPRRVVPTLVLEDGTAIGEVPAICRYIEEVQGIVGYVGFLGLGVRIELILPLIAGNYRQAAREAV